MSIVYDEDGITLYQGDCIDVMRTMEADSIDAVVTDPPYGLEFMGKTWDRLGNVGARDTPMAIPKRTTDDFGGRMAAVPSFNDVPNVRCRNCRHWRYSGTLSLHRPKSRKGRDS